MSMTIVGAFVAGAICGLVPLVYGLADGQTGLAVGGFVGCVIGGLLLGVFLAVPIAAVFAYLIWRRGRQSRAATSPPAAATDSPARAPDPGERRFERESPRDRGRGREPTARR